MRVGGVKLRGREKKWKKNRGENLVSLPALGTVIILWLPKTFYLQRWQSDLLWSGSGTNQLSVVLLPTSDPIKLSRCGHHDFSEHYVKSSLCCHFMAIRSKHCCKCHNLIFCLNGLIGLNLMLICSSLHHSFFHCAFKNL